MCHVCGQTNDFGLKASYYEADNDAVFGVFRPVAGYRGFPGRLPGGTISAILDETIGRTILLKNNAASGITIDLNIKFMKPVPPGNELHIVAKVTKNTERYFEGIGELFLEDGTVAASGTGKYLKVFHDQIPGDSDVKNSMTAVNS